MHCRSNKPFTESKDDFSSASNSSRINWPMSREKRNIGNGGWAETEQSGWLSDYPVLRNICNLRLSPTLLSLSLPLSFSLSRSSSKQARRGKPPSFPVILLHSRSRIDESWEISFPSRKSRFPASTPSCHADPWSRVLMRITMTAIIVDLHEPRD